MSYSYKIPGSGGFQITADNPSVPTAQLVVGQTYMFTNMLWGRYSGDSPDLSDYVATFLGRTSGSVRVRWEDGREDDLAVGSGAYSGWFEWDGLGRFFPHGTETSVEIAERVSRPERKQRKIDIDVTQSGTVTWWVHGREIKNEFGEHLPTVEQAIREAVSRVPPGAKYNLRVTVSKRAPPGHPYTGGNRKETYVAPVLPPWMGATGTSGLEGVRQAAFLGTLPGYRRR